MVLGFFTENYWRFVRDALICYAILVLILFCATTYISGTPFYEIYAYSQFFMASNIFYIVGLFMALVLRSVVSFLESQ